MPQEVLARLGGRPHPLRRQIIAPSEKRIRTLLQALDAAGLLHGDRVIIAQHRIPMTPTRSPRSATCSAP